MNIQTSTNKIKAFAFALSAAVIATAGSGFTSSSAEARTFVKPAATGIGFSQTRHHAKKLAVRAWSKAVRRAYGKRYANFYTARSRRISCDYIGYGRGYKKRGYLRHGGVIGTLGNVRSPWTCTAIARPTKKSAHTYPGPHHGVKPTATGVGYAYSKAGAMGLSVRAWTNAVSSRYGHRYARFSRAVRKDVSCDYIGKRRSIRKRFHSQRGGVYGQAGNVNAPWTCTATGRPRR